MIEPLPAETPAVPLSAPPRHARPGFFGRRLDDGIRGVAEAFFPHNALGAPDFEQAEVLARTRAYLGELPPTQGRMLSALFLAVELAAPLLVPSFRRFSRLAPERRARAVRRWRASRLYLIRLLGDALKATMTMMYMSHPAVIAYTGQFTRCENADDPCRVELRIEPATATAEAP
jgi:hypothetical protein